MLYSIHVESTLSQAHVANETCYIDGRISLINKRSARRPAGRQKIVKNGPGENLAQVWQRKPAWRTQIIIR